MCDAVMRFDQKNGHWVAVVTKAGKVVAEFPFEQWVQLPAVQAAVDRYKDQLEQQQQPAA
jgi:hypothetical protein